MLFNSLAFVLFYPLVTLIYFACPHRYRWAWLLLSSYFFYMCWEPRYALLMGLSTVITYATAWGMHYSRGGWKRFYLTFSLVSNLGILFYFKYYNFFIDSATTALTALGIHHQLPTVEVLLPVGISFYTFQALSYSMDTYRGEIGLERHLGRYALYVSYFPQLVAGPIERSKHLLHQLREKHTFQMERLSSGMLIIAWGFFKKLVVADRIAPIVATVYDAPESFSSPAHILATVLFSLQIYCDFSGYSDIAIGAARIMGIDLMTNFRQPYLAKSIGEFWSRWHISLSTWFRDYLYIPLGGNRCSKPRMYANIMAVFVVSGLWHGANWTFVAWGALNGLYLTSENFLRGLHSKGKPRHNVAAAILRNLTTLALINFAWIFFRANTLRDALYVVSNLHHGFRDFTQHFIQLPFWKDMILQVGSTYLDFAIIALTAGILIVVDIVLNRGSETQRIFLGLPQWVRWSAYYALALLLLFFGVYSNAQFIYFQF